MNFKLTFALLLFCLSILIGTAGATGSCFSGSYPAGATAAYPINVVSTGGTTSTGFQLMFPNLPANTLTGNYLIANSVSGASPGAQWIETANGNTIWAQMNSNTIAASANGIYCLYSFPTATTQWGNQALGAAPQITPSYAQYDNGNYVFTKYWNFAGTSLPTGWSTGGGGSGAVTVNGGISVSVTTGAYDAYYPDTISSSIVMDELSSSQYVATSQADLVGFADAPSPLGNLAAMWYWNGGYTFWSNSGAWVGGYQSSTTSQAYNTKTVFSTYYVPSTSLDWYVNYTHSAQTLSAVPASSALTYIIIGWPNGGGASTETVYWMRLRNYPPSGKMPTVSYGAVQSAGGGGSIASVAISNPTNAIVDVGQYQSVTATATNGISPFTFNFITVNSITHATTGTYKITGQSSPYTYTFQVANPDVANSPEAVNVVETDSASNVVASGYSSTFTINPALVANAPTESNAIIDLGQVSLQTSQASGGTPTLSYQWYSIAGSTAPTCTSANAIAGATASTYLASPSTTTSYAYKVTDQASTAVSLCSTGDTLNENPAMTTPQLNYVSATLLTATWTGGTPNYNALWYSGASPNCASDSLTTQYNSIATTANQITVTVNANKYYCMHITDSASTPATTANSPSNVIGAVLSAVVGNSGNQYETSTQTFTYTINVTKAATSANMLFTSQGANVLWSNQTVNPIAQNFVFNYQIPLQAANGVIYTFNSNPYAMIFGTMVNLGNANTLTQNELWDYVPTEAVKTNPIITGQGQTFFMNITQPISLNLATVNTMLIIGTQNSIYGSLFNYKYYYQSASFIPSLYGIPNPAVGAAVAYNSMVKLTFNGNSVYRNLTSSFTVNAPLLIACGSPIAFQWSFFNATSLTQIGANVLLSGYFYIQEGLYTSNTMAGTSVGFSVAATANTYNTCMAPTWAKFNTYGVFQYAQTNYSTAQFLLVNQLTSNVMIPLNLYMQQITNPSTYDIVVENGTNNFVSAYVQELLYNINLNQSVLVNEFQTPQGGGYVTNLQYGSYYQFRVYTSTGQLLNTTDNVQASCSAGNVCVYYINIGNSQISNPSKYQGNIKYACSVVPNNVTNVTGVSCSVSSLNGTSINSTLTIYQNQIFQNIVACAKTIVSASSYLTCSAGSVNTTSYSWQLTYINQYGTLLTLTSGNFGSASSGFGNDGVIIALLIVAMLGVVLIFANPMLGVILGVIGMIVSGILGLITLSLPAMGFLIVFGAIIAFALRAR